jgi:hypothetical protein
VIDSSGRLDEREGEGEWEGNRLAIWRVWQGIVLGLATTTSCFELPPPGQNLPLEPIFRSNIT